MGIGHVKMAEDELIDIVGINASNRGRSCEEHVCCGLVLEPDSLVRIKAVQIVVSGQEETALAVHWVTDGEDRCRVGFLRRHLVKHKKKYNGRLAQVVEIFSDKSESPSDRQKFNRSKGCCRAALVDVSAEEEISPAKKRPASDNNKEDIHKKPKISTNAA